MEVQAQFAPPPAANCCLQITHAWDSQADAWKIEEAYHHSEILVGEADVAFGLTRKRIFSALTIALLVLAAFAFGFVSSLHLKSTVSSDLRRQYLLQAGDAPVSVRTGVLAALRDFQEGYIKRDPKELDSFMNRLFPKNDDILLLGTDAGEWARGYPAVGEFIRTDWLDWGDFRFSVDDSAVWSSGDVAWIASIGTVHEHGSDRPLRFSAILTRTGSKWLFREAHFQWDDRDPSPADLLRADTHLKLFRWVLQYLRHMAQSAGKTLQPREWTGTNISILQPLS